MPKAVDLTGKKFGKLTVGEYVGSRISSGKLRRYYKATCECGGTIELPGERFKSGQTASCGCMRWRTGPSNPKWGGCGEISGSYWDHVSRGAKQRKFEFDISIEQAWDLFLKQNKKCALSGVPLIFGTDQTASLDRIDSMNGYVVGNVQWVHKDINRMKQHFDEPHFIRLCMTVTEYQKGVENE